MDPADPLSQWRARRMGELQASAAARTAAGAAPQDLSLADFDQFLADHPIVMVDFWATWCGPCHQVAPIVQEMVREWAGRIAVAKVDTDRQPELTMRYRVSAMPTFLFFKQGQVAGRLLGVQPPAAFRQVGQELLEE